MTKLLPKYQKGKNVIRIIANEGYQDVPISNHTYTSSTPLGYVIPEVTVTPSEQQQAQMSRKQTAQAWRDFDKDATNIIYDGVRTAAYLNPKTAPIMTAVDMYTDPEIRKFYKDYKKQQQEISQNTQHAGWKGRLGAYGTIAALGLLGYGGKKLGPKLWDWLKANKTARNWALGLLGITAAGEGVSAIEDYIEKQKNDSNYIYNESSHINDPDSTFIKSLQNLEIK